MVSATLPSTVAVRLVPVIISFDEETLIKSTILNYVKNNNINVDDVEFEIALDEVNNIVTITISTEKDVFDANSKSSYTFSYQVVER